MPESSAEPICPSCGYDLTANFADQPTLVKCPECGENWGFGDATRIESRQRCLRWAEVAIILAPALYLGILILIERLNGVYYYVEGFSHQARLGGLALLSMPYIFLVSIACAVAERRYRSGRPYARFSPRMPFFLASLFVSVAASLIISIVLLVMLSA